MQVRVLSEYAGRYHLSDGNRSPAFCPETVYEVYGLQRAVDVGGGFVVLASDNGELFFVEMRHVRVVKPSDVPNSAMVMMNL